MCTVAQVSQRLQFKIIILKSKAAIRKRKQKLITYIHRIITLSIIYGVQIFSN